MVKRNAFNGNPYAGNPHVRFEERKVTSAATPRRGSLLYTRLLMIIGVAAVTFAATAETLTVAKDTVLSADATYDSVDVAANATLDLNGHKLTTGGLTGGGMVMSATMDAKPLAIDGYTLLDYVETPSDNASVFIDTLYKPSCNDRVETKVESGLITGNQSIFSSRKTSVSQQLSCIITESKFRFDRNDKYGVATSSAISRGTPYALYADFKSSTFKIDGGTALTASGGTGNFTAYTNIFLFALGQYKSETQYDIGSFATSMKMYYFHVYDGDGKLQVALAPAKAPDGTVGFYDVVRKKFLAPAAGTLTASDPTYSALSYVQSPPNNATLRQHVETAYIPLLTDRIEAKIRIGDPSGFQGVFSARMKDGTNSFSCVQAQGPKLRFDHHTLVPFVYHHVGSTDTTYANTRDYEIVMDGNTLDFSVNGVVSDTKLTANPPDESASPGIALRLFAIATKGAGHDNYANGCRIYYLRAYDKDGNVKLNLFPAERASDGVVGFYDATRDSFLTAQGLVGGKYVPEDLTTPECTCMCRPSGDGDTTAANLFNNNLTYRADSVSRLYFPASGNKALPLRVDYDFGEGNEKVVNMYSIWGGYTNRSPAAWEFYGSDSAYGSADEADWTLLDTGAKGSNLPGVASGNTADCCTRAFDNKAAYRYYRLKVTAGGAGGAANYFEVTQLEYFHIDETETPGELCVNVADGAAATNSTVCLGGNMKVSKEGDGAFALCADNSFYTGGTDVNAGSFIVGAPLSTALTMAEGTTLGFLLRDNIAAPLLMPEVGSSFPANLVVSIDRASDDVKLGKTGRVLTDGYNFGGTALNFTATDWARNLSADGDGNLVVRGRSGLMIIFR